MPERTKKDQKLGRHSGHTGSRWHNFHFSGKLISCSVIFGFLLILVGGILLAIGMDGDDERKSNDYEDLQKKPPLMFVGPAVIGIGGFTVVVGVIMCLVETKVFRRRGGDANPLISSEGRETSLRSNEATNGGTDPTAIPPDSKQYRKHRHCKKSHRKPGNDKKSHSPKSLSSIETSTSSSQCSEPIGISEKGSRNFLNASDTFLTPPGSFTQEDIRMQKGKREALNQTTASLMKSFNSSGAYSTEFQTPSASFIDIPDFPGSQESTEVPTPQPFLNIPDNLNEKTLENAKHEFLTPQNSNADILEPPKNSKEVKLKQENSPVVNRHAFLTPKNSTDLLEESPSTEETLENRMGNISNHPDIFVNKKSPDNVTKMNIVADVHEPPMPQEEIEHSDIKVDVLIDALDEEIKDNIHSSKPNIKYEETEKFAENIENNQNFVTENSKGIEENSDDLTEENKTDREDSVKVHSLDIISGDNFNTHDMHSNDDLNSKIDDNLDSLKNDHDNE